jgi:hypothetical protein
MMLAKVAVDIANTIGRFANWAGLGIAVPRVFVMACRALDLEIERPARAPAKPLMAITAKGLLLSKALESLPLLLVTSSLLAMDG